MREKFGMPPVVFYLLTINTALWLLVRLAIFTKNPAMNAVFDSFLLFPVDTGLFRPWQLITSMFMHVEMWHLAVNMFFGLWMFGRTLEYDLGSKRFLLYYMVCGIGAGLLQLLISHLTGSFDPSLGASGATFGLLLAFGLMRPEARIMIIFLPFFSFKAKWIVLILGSLELAMGLANIIRPFDHIAHFAHVGGMLWGFMLLLYWKYRRIIRY
jgi:membrane associated rhomboid family serine protease